jgi:hypothetical protein
VAASAVVGFLWGFYQQLNYRGILQTEAANEVRTGVQPDERKGAWHHHPAIAAAARGRGDLVMDRCAWFVGLALLCMVAG